MPTYHTGCVNIRLSAADYNKTITPNPVTHQSKESSANIEKALKEFQDHGRTLAETTLRNPDGYSLGFLGEYRHIPFLMVHASPFISEKNPPPSQPVHNDGQDSPLSELPSSPLSPFPTSSNQAEDSFGSPSFQLYEREQGAQPQEETKPLKPQALCLRILPTRRTFHCAGKPRKVKWGHSDMKMDVFLNGALCSSTHISESAFHKRDPLRDTFSGAKVGRMIEKPWVLAAEDRVAQVHGAEDVANRWNEIAQAHKLAAESYGRNEKYELSLLGDYLQSLAGLPVPATLPEMLETGNERFAIIDVIITAGKGRKEDASAPYLMRPMPLRLHGFGIRSEDWSIKVLPPPITPPPRPRIRQRSIHPARSAADAEILSQQFSLEYVRRGNAGRVTRPIDNHEDQASSPAHPDGHHTKGQLTIPGRLIMEVTNTPSPLGTPAINRAPEFKPQSHSAPTPTPIPIALKSNQAKRPRMLYHDVIDTRQTREEELNDIMQQAANRETDRLVTRSRFADTTREPHDLPTPTPRMAAANHTSNAPVPPSPTKIVTLKYSSPTRTPAPVPSIPPPTSRKRPLDPQPPALNPYTATADTSSSPAHSLLQQLHPATPNPNAHASDPWRENPQLDGSSIPPFPATQQTRGIDPPSVGPPKKKKGKAVERWVVPEASKGAVVGFAEGEVVRQVRSERAGWFREEGVLVGVRFVVG
ncbi:MAG: hypothetical protein Q9182_005908 [Xanthomendoza sp. 2 TL-2023]